MRQFVIGDVHGCKISLVALLKKLDMQFDDELYFLGDYIDRGPDSKGVFDTIFNLLGAGYKVQCLLGNHEAMLLGALGGDTDEHISWRKNGGKQTLQSFKYQSIHDFSHTYIDFMAKMPLVLEVNNYILVHGGLNFNAKNPIEPSQQMIWIRDWYKKIDYKWLDNRIIVHGHTPQSALETLRQSEVLDRDRVLNIDCGCVFNNDYLHTLVCFELTSKRLYFQRNIEEYAF
jgi:serine/threonine protein phosphatase 1